MWCVKCEKSRQQWREIGDVATQDGKHSFCGKRGTFFFFFTFIDEMFLFGLFVLGQRAVFFKENDEVKGRR